MHQGWSGASQLKKIDEAKHPKDFFTDKKSGDPLIPNPHWTRRHKCKQMEPAVVNGSVYTYTMQHQRNCPQLLSSSVDWA